jgi:hypothetical protein
MTPAPQNPSCPECEHGPEMQPVLGRRDFIRVLGTSAAAVAVGRRLWVSDGDRATSGDDDWMR